MVWQRPVEHDRRQKDAARKKAMNIPPVIQSAPTQDTTVPNAADVVEAVKQQFGVSPAQTPTREDVAAAAEALGVPVNKHADKGKVPPKSMREQAGLSQRDVYALAEKIHELYKKKQQRTPLTERDMTTYRELSQRNKTVGELAYRYGISVEAFKVFVADNLEKTILNEETYLRKRHGVNLLDRIVRVPDEAESEDSFLRQADEDRATDEASIAKSGGAEVNGRIVSRGMATNYHPLALDSFDRTGKMHEDAQEAPDYRDDGMPDHDDYGDESSA
jgi:DNA-binding CsgD family transcriptional regulator